VARALAAIERVAAGRLLLSVPYGRREDHGWLRQFDREDVKALCDAVEGRATTTVFPLHGLWLATERPRGGGCDDVS
jgi:hypothetical protein